MRVIDTLCFKKGEKDEINVYIRLTYSGSLWCGIEKASIKNLMSMEDKTDWQRIYYNGENYISLNRMVKLDDDNFATQIILTAEEKKELQTLLKIFLKTKYINNYINNKPQHIFKYEEKDNKGIFTLFESIDYILYEETKRFIVNYEDVRRLKSILYSHNCYKVTE
jgi:hypothetical protein